MVADAPKNVGQSTGEVRQAARSYIAQLREARRARVAGQQAPDAPTAKARPDAPAKPKIGKRGVRLGEGSVSLSSPAHTPAKSQNQQGRVALRSGALQARAAAQEAKQKIREARLKQSAAAVKQREHLKAARAMQAAARAQAKAGAAPDRSGQTPKAAPVLSRAVAAKLPSPSLKALRGIGDAMSCRLQQIGIADVNDLITHTPEDIRNRLGPISALANVEAWQAQAAAYLEEAPSTECNLKE